ncbi:MAG: DUF2939 domain-containing protein [Pseudomonas sp.]
MRKWWWTLPLATLLAVAGYIAAGPYLAIRAIDQAIARQDTAALERHVDFPSLRASLKIQLEDALLRRAGPELQSNPFGRFARQAIGGLTSAGVDTMVTPLGIGALLQGRTLWKRGSGDTVGGDSYAAPKPDRPLARYEGHFDSTSRFSATVHTPSGNPVVFVFHRDGLRWRLANIVLPLDP